MPLEILSLPFLCGDHVRELSRIYRGEGPLEDREVEFAGVLGDTDSCPACLRIRWQKRFDDASRSLRKDPLAVYLNDMAELKRTFAGYPVEVTPRTDRRSVEEFLLREGQPFPSQPLAPDEQETVRQVYDELKRLRDRELDSRAMGGSKVHMAMILDLGRLFATAQRAWRAGHGALEYVEGFARHGEQSPYRFGWYRESMGPLYYGWNLINGKVVDFCSRRLPKDDDEFWTMLRDLPFEACVVGSFDPATEYFGRVLTPELEHEFQSIPGRFMGERILYPDEGTTSLREQLQRERDRGELGG